MTYREGEQAIDFDWEFGGGDVVALLFGPPAEAFDRTFPWAAGRQRAVFDHVAAEVIGRQAPSCVAHIDRDRGWIELRPGTATAVSASASASASVPVPVPVPVPDTTSPEPEVDLEERLCHELRALHRPDDGLDRALRLARAHPTAAVRQALLWASWNRTPCAPACAALLLDLAGHAPSPDDPIVAGLSDHASSFERHGAFAALCAAIGEELDVDQG